MVMGTLGCDPIYAIYAALLFAYIGVITYLARKAAKGDDGRAIDMKPFRHRPVSWPSTRRSDPHAARFRKSRRLAALGLRLAHGPVDPDLRGPRRASTLGVGILFPLATPAEQDRMIGSIGPFWDANETWLVLAVGLPPRGPFPQAHGMILTALYLPVFVMLVGLILRGVAFEFPRPKVRDHHKRLWNRLFFNRLPDDRTGAGFHARPLRHGAGTDPCHLRLRHAHGGLPRRGLQLHRFGLAHPQDRGALQWKAIRWGRESLWGRDPWHPERSSLATLALSPTRIFDKWLTVPEIFYLAPLPILSGLLIVWLWRMLRQMPLTPRTVAPWLPFATATALFALAYLGMAYSFYPYGGARAADDLRGRSRPRKPLQSS